MRTLLKYLNNDLKGISLSNIYRKRCKFFSERKIRGYLRKEKVLS